MRRMPGGESVCFYFVSLLCYNRNQMILLGTLSGEIFEMSDFDGSNIHKGPLSLGTYIKEEPTLQDPSSLS